MPSVSVRRKGQSWMVLFLGMRRDYRQKKRGSVRAAPASFNRIIKRI